MNDEFHYNYPLGQVLRDNERHMRDLKASNPDLYQKVLARSRSYQCLIERNPHPMHISIPNPAWQAWMDEHDT